MKKWLLRTLYVSLLIAALFVSFVVGYDTGRLEERFDNVNRVTQICVREEVILKLPYEGKVYLYACTYLGQELPKKQTQEIEHE